MANPVTSPYCCPECPQSFFDSFSELRVHVEYDHSLWWLVRPAAPRDLGRRESRSLSRDNRFLNRRDDVSEPGAVLENRPVDVVGQSRSKEILALVVRYETKLDQITESTNRTLFDKDSQLTTLHEEYQCLLTKYQNLTRDYKYLSLELEKQRGEASGLHSSVARKSRGVTRLQNLLKRASRSEAEGRNRIEEFLEELIQRTVLAELKLKWAT